MLELTALLNSFLVSMLVVTHGRRSIIDTSVPFFGAQRALVEAVEHLESNYTLYNIAYNLGHLTARIIANGPRL